MSLTAVLPVAVDPATSSSPVASPLHRLAGRASSFDERLAGACQRIPTPADRLAARRARWIDRLGATDDPATFTRRLAWDQISDAQVTELLHDADWRPDVPLPLWTATLEAAIGATPDACAARFAAAGATANDRAVRVADPVPFEELILPFITHARAAVAAHVASDDGIVAASALADLERTLLIRLARLAQRPFFHEFSRMRAAVGPAAALPLAGPDGRPARTHYLAFCASQQQTGFPLLFDAYPVLAKLLAEATRQWIQATSELLTRLHADAAELPGALGADGPVGPLVAVTSDAGDPHDEGRAVALLTFASGWRCVYKPRGIGLDALWARVVEWLNGAVPEGTPALRSAALLPRDSYGWIAFVTDAPCDDQAAVERFYERAGLTLAVVYALTGSDFHLENVLASGEWPVLIDHEALLSARALFSEPTSPTLQRAVELTDAVGDSVMITGLLPLIRPINDGAGAIDLGGLTGARDERIGVQVTYWRFANTDLMRLATQPAQPGVERNVPRVGTDPVYASHFVTAIVRGFRTGYDTISAHRSHVAALVQAAATEPGRLIYRNTSVYAQLLDRSAHPRFLADATERWMDFESLARAFLVLDEPPIGWTLLRHERHAMELQNVPLFATPLGQSALTLPDGSVLPDFFQQHAIARCQERLARLSAVDGDRQTAYVQQAFLAAGRHRELPVGEALSPWDTPVAASVTPPTTAARALARSLASQVDASAQRFSDGSPFWIGIARMPRYARFSLQPLSVGYGDGACGVALLHAALADDALERERAHAALRDLLEEEDNTNSAATAADLRRAELGLTGGVAGIAVALVRAARLLDDDRYLALAQRQGRKMELLLASTLLSRDLLTGRAGVVLALLELHALDGDTRWLHAAQQYAEPLRTAATTSSSPIRVHSLGWGGAGEALALHALGHRLSDTSLRALATERASAAVADAITRLESPVPRAIALGTGALGVALAAHRCGLALPDGWTDLLFSPAMRLPTDDVLSGEAGRLLVATALDRPERELLVARLLADRASADRCVTAWGADAPQPGLFTGRAGIGYTLLASIEPARIPSLIP